MTSQEFLQEVLSSDICPDNFEQIYTEFQQYQQAAIDTLNEFHRVCEKNGIHYQLAHGSLLGAIRDGGQIPWDYDVDVMVPIWERDRMIEILKSELNENYYFLCPEVDRKCRHNIMRIAPKGYSTQVLHVDVFYYTGSADEEEERKQHQEEIRQNVRKRYGKLVNCWEVASGDLRRYCSVLIKRKIPGQFFSLKAIEKEYDHLCWKYPHNGAKYYVSVDGFRRCYSANYLDNTILYETSIGTFRVSAAYHKVLEYRYGNYTELFPLKNRLAEMLIHYRQLKFHETKRSSH